MKITSLFFCASVGIVLIAAMIRGFKDMPRELSKKEFNKHLIWTILMAFICYMQIFVFAYVLRFGR